MSPLLALLFVLLGAGALVLLAVWLERATRHVGLTMLLAGLSSLSGAVIGLLTKPGVLHAVFAIQAVAFFYSYAWQRREARKSASGAPGV